MSDQTQSNMQANHMINDLQKLHARVDEALHNTIRQNIRLNQNRQNRIQYYHSLSPSKLKNPSSSSSEKTVNQNISGLKSFHINIPEKKEFSAPTSELTSKTPLSISTSRPNLQKENTPNLSKLVYFNPFHPQNPTTNTNSRIPQTTRERNFNVAVEKENNENFKKSLFKQFYPPSPPTNTQQISIRPREPPQTCRDYIERPKPRIPLVEPKNEAFTPRYNKEQLDQIIAGIQQRNKDMSTNRFTQKYQFLEKQSPSFNPPAYVPKNTHSVPEQYKTERPLAPTKLTTQIKPRTRVVQSCRTSYHQPQYHKQRNTQFNHEPVINNYLGSGNFRRFPQQEDKLEPLTKEEDEEEEIHKERLESSTINYRLGTEDLRLLPKHTFASLDDDVHKILQLFDNDEADQQRDLKQEQRRRQKRSHKNQAIVDQQENRENFNFQNIDYYCGKLENDTNESLRFVPETVLVKPDLADMFKNRKISHKRTKSEGVNSRSGAITRRNLNQQSRGNPLNIIF